MHTPAHGKPLVLLRFSGEVATKARATRRQFTTRLLRNVKDALAAHGHAAEVERRHDRVFLHVSSPEAAEPLRRVFGIQSLSRVERRPAASAEEVVREALPLFREAVRGRRFAVRARTVGEGGRKRIRPRDVEVRLGEALRPESAGVDLTRPEVTAYVELYRGDAYLFTERIPGEGGIPVGSEGRALALVSGGFDSAVAAWQMLRRGVALDHVFFNLGGFSHRLGTLRVMKVLADRWSYGTRPKLLCVDLQDVSRDLQARTHPRYWQVILKRLMLRAAERIARERGLPALVTGESVGQVSSQTLANLATIGSATELPLLRPLVGANKDAIVRMAEHVGTAPLSAVVGEYCALVPRRPATSARLEDVRREEAKLDAGLLEKAVSSRETVDLRAADPEATGLPEIESERVPEDAVVLDLRSRPEYESWHAPGALRLDFPQALEAYPSFDKGQTYLLYCEYGLKSAHLAELMRRAGLDARHFRGGVPALRRYLARERGGPLT